MSETKPCIAKELIMSHLVLLEKCEDIKDGAQQIDGIWYGLKWGCDTIQTIIDDFEPENTRATTEGFEEYYKSEFPIESNDPNFEGKKERHQKTWNAALAAKPKEFNLEALRRKISGQWAEINIQFVGFKARQAALDIIINEMNAVLASAPAEKGDGKTVCLNCRGTGYDNPDAIDTNDNIPCIECSGTGWVRQPAAAKLPCDYHWHILTDSNRTSKCPKCGEESHSKTAVKAEDEALRPTIVCLCGSTRFSEAFQMANFKETLEGKIVLSIGCDFKSDTALRLTETDKTRLDELHKRKIDLADEVLILNVGGYIGESTRSEINYAIAHNKKVRYLESV